VESTRIDGAGIRAVPGERAPAARVQTTWIRNPDVLKAGEKVSTHRF